MIDRIGKHAALALGLIAIGLATIGFSWAGAAARDCIQCQFPYLLSGGLGGLSLVILGGGLLLFESSRRMMVRMEEKFDEVVEALHATAGHAPKPDAPADTPTPVNGAVVIGRSSFHLPTCRLVEGKEEQDTASAEEATARGLKPCRVCDPLALTSN